MSNNRMITPEQLLRHFIGYDRVAANSSAFPPHNIEKISEDAYRLTLAVAGFDRSEIEMYEHKGTLTISGRKAPTVQEARPVRGDLDVDALNEWVDDKGNVKVDPRERAAASQAALNARFAIDEPAPQGATFLHQGIALRDWDRQFNLGEFIEVRGASMANGLLMIDLERRVPEEHKPKLIDIRA